MKKLDVHFKSQRMDWATPRPLFKRIEARFGPFTLDVCANASNAKCKRFFSPAEDGLRQPWQGVCWMNPPYGCAIKHWMAKAYSEACHGARVVCLVPARTDTAWWHDYASRGYVIFLKGRVSFLGGKHTAPFPSAVVVFDFSPKSGLPQSTRYTL